MAYRCVNCDYTENRRFKNGRCPRCDSYNIKSEKERLDYRQHRKHLSLGKGLLFAALLALLAYGIWDRYNNPPLSLEEEYQQLLKQFQD